MTASSCLFVSWLYYNTPLIQLYRCGFFPMYSSSRKIRISFPFFSFSEFLPVGLTHTIHKTNLTHKPITGPPPWHNLTTVDLRPKKLFFFFPRSLSPFLCSENFFKSNLASSFLFVFLPFAPRGVWERGEGLANHDRLINGA